MKNYLLAGRKRILLDKEGYLRNLDDWQINIATQLAANEKITLNPAHMEIIHLLRDFYRQHQHSPATRALVNLVARELGSDKGKSIYLMKLFTGSPAKMASKIAGLPKPDNCI